MFTHSRLLASLVAAAAFTWPAVLLAAEHNPVAREPRMPAARHQLDVIVKLRPEASSASNQKASTVSDRGAALARRTGLAVLLKREVSASLLASSVELADASANEVLARLRADPQVEYVALDSGSQQLRRD